MRRTFLALGALTLSACAQPHEPPAATALFGFDREAFGESGISAMSDFSHQAHAAGVAGAALHAHADRAGGAGYNQVLSQRRARFTRAELIARGFDPASVTFTAHGESAPVAPTADGVRELLNRRVEVSAGPRGVAAPRPAPWTAPVPAQR